MIYHIQPVMILSLLPLAVYIEGLSVISTEKFFRTEDFVVVQSNVLWILVGAVLAFFLESSEFLVVTYTSSLTLSISGIFKEVCVIYLAVVWNNNKLNPMNTIGLVLCIVGIAIHVVIKAMNPNELTKGKPFVSYQ
jgi:solute carrier family 35 protein C2